MPKQSPFDLLTHAANQFPALKDLPRTFTTAFVSRDKNIIKKAHKKFENAAQLDGLGIFLNTVKGAKSLLRERLYLLESGTATS